MRILEGKTKEGEKWTERIPSRSRRVNVVSEEESEAESTKKKKKKQKARNSKRRMYRTAGTAGVTDQNARNGAKRRNGTSQERKRRE